MKHLLTTFERHDVSATSAAIVGSPSARRRNSRLKHLAFMLLFLVGSLNVWGTEEVYKTALFGSDYNSASKSDYTSTWSATNDGFTVSLSNFNNNSNSWDYVKCGRKNNASVATIISAEIDKTVTKVVVTIDAITAAKVNSIKLYRSSDNSSWTEESSFAKSTGAQEATIASANRAANLYYKVEFDCASGSSNGLVTISKVEYYVEADGPSQPTLSVAPTTIDFGTVDRNAEVEDKTVAVTFANLTGSVTYSGLTSPFSASGAISATGDEITIAANTATIGEYSQTLTVQSAADSKSQDVTVKMNVVEPFDGLKLTFDVSSNPGEWPTSDNAGNFTYTLNSTNYTFALGSNVYCNSGYLMLKATTTLGLPAISGYKLVKVEATNSSGCSTATKVKISSNEDGSTVVTGGNEQTWSTTSTKYTYDLTNTAPNTMYYLYVSNKNCQLVSLTLYYEESQALVPVVTPEISGDETFLTSTSVEITTTTQDATIYYTTDGTDPTTDSEVYSSAIPVSETTTIKAFAVKTGMADSEIASKTFTKATVQTVTEALAAIDALEDNATITNQYVSGTISQIDEYSDKYHSITYWISVDGTTENQLEIYGGKGINGANFTATTDLNVGDDVTVNGTLKKYVSEETTIPEFVSGSSIITRKPIARLSWSGAGLENGEFTAEMGKTNTFPTLINTDEVNPIIYSCDPAGLVTIASNGSITLPTEGEGGTTVITASFAGNDTYKTNSASYTLHVSAPIAVSSIELNETSVSLEINATKQLSATVLPTDATNKLVTWSSNAESVATVDENGLVTAVADEGTAIITCTSQSTPAVFATCTITATPHVVKAGRYEVLINNALWGSELTGSLSGDNLKNYSGSNSDISFEYNKGTGSNMYFNAAQTRFYKGNQLVITAPTGFKLTKIESLVNTIQANVGTIESNIWTGNNNSVILSHSGESGNSTLTTIYVTYEALVPEVTVSPSSLSFDAKQNIAVEGKKFIVTGENVASDLSLVASTGFTVSPSSITAADVMAEGGVEVTITPETPTTTTTPVEGTVTISGGGLTENVVVNLSMTVTPTYQVAVAVNDDDMGSATINGGTASIYVTDDEEIALVATPNTGYEFVEWTVSDEDITIDDENAASTTALAAVAGTITANFQQQQCTNLKAPTLDGQLSVSYNIVTINWAAVTEDTNDAAIAEGGLFGYAVTIKQGDEVIVDNDPTDELTYTKNGLLANTSYHYIIMAIGNSPTYCDASNPTLEGDFTTPDYPAATLTLIENGTTQYNFAGNHKVNDEVTLPNTLVGPGCVGNKMLVGWSSEAISETDATPSSEIYWSAGTSYKLLAESQTLYAVMADGSPIAPQNNSVFATTSLGSTNTVTEGFAVSAQAEKKTGYYQDGSGDTRYVQVMTNNTATPIIPEAPTAITVSATLGGGSAQGLGNPVYAVLLDASGNALGDAVALTSEITAQTGSPFAVSMPIEHYANVRGVRVSHVKESGYNVRYYAISLSYSTGGGYTYTGYTTSCTAALDKPTISPKAGELTEVTSVTLSHPNNVDEDANNDVAIYYTLDGSDPTSESTSYTEAITLDKCGTTTIKAIAIKDDSQSAVASATYTLNLGIPANSAENPYDVATAKSVYDGGCYDNQDVYVTGTVTNATWYSNSGTYTITLEGDFQFYYFYKAANNTPFTNQDAAIEEGDVLVACGKLGTHSQKYQLGQGCYLVSHTPHQEPVTGVELDQTDVSIAVGEDVTLIATISPANATNKTVIWTSSNQSIAVVSDGKVTGVAAGNVTITATTADGGFTATCAVTVREMPALRLVAMGNTYRTIFAAEGSSVSELLVPVPAVSGYTSKGWSKVVDSAAEEDIITSDNDIVLTEDVTLYAVYASYSCTYTKVTSTSDITDGAYLIVYEDEALAFNGGLATLDASNNTVPVIINNGVITGTAVTMAAEFTIDANAGTLLSKSGYYIGQNSDANGMATSTSQSQASTNTLSIDASGNFVAVSGGAYMRYNSTSGQERFRYFKSSTYSSQKAIQLYKKVNGAEGTPVSVVDVTVHEGETLNTADVFTDGVAGGLKVETGGRVVVNNSLTTPSIEVEEGAVVTITATVTTPTFRISAAPGQNATSGQVYGAQNVAVPTGDIFMDFQLIPDDAVMPNGIAGYWYSISAPFTVSVNDGIFMTDGTHLINNTHIQVWEFAPQQYANGGRGWKRVNVMQRGQAYLIGFDPNAFTAMSKAVPNVVRLKATSLLADLTNFVVEAFTGSTRTYLYNGFSNPNTHNVRVSGSYQYYDNINQRFSTINTALIPDMVVGTPFFYAHSEGGTADENLVINDPNATLAPTRIAGNEYMFCLQIRKPDSRYYDNQMYICASEDAALTFESGKDVETMNDDCSSLAAVIWTNAYGKRLAVQDAPLVNNQAIYDLTIVTPKAGTYVLRQANEVEGADLYVTYEGQIVWNLSLGDYELDLARGTTTGYGLLLVAQPNQMPTGVEEVGGDQSELSGDAVQKILLNGQLYILRDGHLYDAVGKEMK